MLYRISGLLKIILINRDITNLLEKELLLIKHFITVLIILFIINIFN